MTNKEATLLFNAITVAKPKYEREKKVPIAPMPGSLAFEQGYIAGFEAAMELAQELRNAVKVLIDDASNGEDGFWRLGPYADTPDSRLAIVKAKISKFE